ncbi:hypothetical protein GGF31_004165 [Allomyces arbusculus]|nr:hypothetical protein GGF31_004165 [Allomyces arbusculus]
MHSPKAALVALSAWLSVLTILGGLVHPIGAASPTTSPPSTSASPAPTTSGPPPKTNGTAPPANASIPSTCFPLATSAYCGAFQGAALHPVTTANGTMLYNTSDSYTAWLQQSLLPQPFVKRMIDNFGCSNDSAPTFPLGKTGLRHYVSFQCASSIAQSTECWDRTVVQAVQQGRPPPPGTKPFALCRSSCTAFVDSLENLMVKNGDVCRGPSPAVKAGKIQEMRNLCTNSVWFNATSNCVDAAKAEELWCGLAPLPDMCGGCEPFAGSSGCKELAAAASLATPTPSSAPTVDPAANSDAARASERITIIAASTTSAVVAAVVIGLMVMVRRRQRLARSNQTGPAPNGSSNRGTPGSARRDSAARTGRRGIVIDSPRRGSNFAMSPFKRPSLQTGSPVLQLSTIQHSPALHHSSLAGTPVLAPTIGTVSPAPHHSSVLVGQSTESWTIPLPDQLAPLEMLSPSLGVTAFPSPVPVANRPITLALPPTSTISRAVLQEPSSAPAGARPVTLVLPPKSTISRLPPLPSGEAPIMLVLPPNSTINRRVSGQTATSPIYQLPSTLSSRGRGGSSGQNRSTMSPTEYVLPSTLTSRRRTQEPTSPTPGSAGEPNGEQGHDGAGASPLPSLSELPLPAPLAPVSRRESSLIAAPSPTHSRVRSSVSSPAPATPITGAGGASTAGTLTTTAKYRVTIRKYDRQLEDEMTLMPGDMIEVLEAFEDGWALGINLTRGSTGDEEGAAAFPLVCTVPVAMDDMRRMSLMSASATPRSAKGAHHTATMATTSRKPSTSGPSSSTQAPGAPKIVQEVKIVEEKQPDGSVVRKRIVTTKRITTRKAPTKTTTTTTTKATPAATKPAAAVKPAATVKPAAAPTAKRLSTASVHSVKSTTGRSSPAPTKTTTASSSRTPAAAATNKDTARHEGNNGHRRSKSIEDLSFNRILDKYSAIAPTATVPVPPPPPPSTLLLPPTPPRSVTPASASDDTASIISDASSTTTRLHVTQRSLHQHVALLRQMMRLTPEFAAPMPAATVIALEERYLRWLAWLATRPPTAGISKLLPPLDVLYAWYTHLACDLTSYADDLGALFGQDARDAILATAFPLNVAWGEYGSTDHQELWLATTGHAWDLEDDLATRLSNVVVSCRTCGTQTSVPVETYVDVFQNGHGAVSCAACHATISIETMVQHLSVFPGDRHHTPLFRFTLNLAESVQFVASQIMTVVDNLPSEEFGVREAAELSVVVRSLLATAAGRGAGSTEPALQIEPDVLLAYWNMLMHPQDYFDFSLERFGKIVILNQEAVIRSPLATNSNKPEPAVIAAKTPAKPALAPKRSLTDMKRHLDKIEKEVQSLAPGTGAAAANSAAASSKIKGPSVNALRAMFESNKKTKRKVQVNVAGKVEPSTPWNVLLTQESLNGHLDLLESFAMHLSLARHQDKHVEGMVDTRYLLKAEQRYYLWLVMLSEGSSILPPIDVLLCWYSHMTHMPTYEHDLRTIFGNEALPALLAEPFPLQQFLTQALNRTVDVESQNAWEAYTGQPFVLLHNADVVEHPWVLQCPSCCSYCSVEVADFVKLRMGEKSVECPVCWRVITKQQLLLMRDPQVHAAFSVFSIDLVRTVQEWRHEVLSQLIDLRVNNVNFDAAVEKYQSQAWKRSVVVTDAHGQESVFHLESKDWTTDVLLAYLTHTMWPNHFIAAARGQYGVAADHHAYHLVLQDAGLNYHHWDTTRGRPLRLRKSAPMAEVSRVTNVDDVVVEEGRRVSHADLQAMDHPLEALITADTVKEVQTMAKYLARADVKPHLASPVYLAAAVRRYALYLKALKASPEVDSLVMPVDVALMMQVHMSSPAAFAADIAAFASNAFARQRIFGKVAPLARAAASEPLDAEVQAQWGQMMHEPYVLSLKDAVKALARSKVASPASFDLAAAVPVFVKAVAASTNVSVGLVRDDYKNVMAKSMIVTSADGTQELYSIATETAAATVGQIIHTGRPAYYQPWFHETFGVALTDLAPPAPVATKGQSVKITLTLDMLDQPAAEKQDKYSKIAFAKFLSVKLLKQLHQVYAALTESDDVAAQLANPAFVAKAATRYLAFVQAGGSAASVPDVTLPFDVAVVMQAHMVDVAAFEMDMEARIPATAQRARFLQAVKQPLLRAVTQVATTKDQAAWTALTGLEYDASMSAHLPVDAADLVFDFTTAVPKLMAALTLAMQVPVADIEAVRKAYERHVDSMLVQRNEEDVRSVYLLRPEDAHAQLGSFMHATHAGEYQRWFKDHFGVKVSAVSGQRPKKATKARVMVMMSVFTDKIVAQDRNVVRDLPTIDVIRAAAKSAGSVIGHEHAAVAQYVRYIQALASNKPSALTAPVALVLVAHMLSPVEFKRDIGRLVPAAKVEATIHAARAALSADHVDSSYSTVTASSSARLARLEKNLPSLVAIITKAVHDHVATPSISYRRAFTNALAMTEAHGKQLYSFMFSPEHALAHIDHVLSAGYEAECQTQFGHVGTLFAIPSVDVADGAEDAVINEATLREVQIGAKYLSRADVKAHLANKAYLDAAERRYVAYLNALNATPEATAIFPPADVALMMQLHMALAPAFVRDMHAFARDESAYQRIMAVTAPFFKSVAAEPLNADLQAMWGRITHEPFVLTANDANRALTASQAYKRTSPISVELAFVLPQFVETVMASTKVTAAQVEAEHDNWANKAVVVTLADGMQELASIKPATPVSRIGCVISTGRPLQHQAWFETTYGVPMTKLAPAVPEKTAGSVKVTVALDTTKKNVDATPKYSKLAFAKCLSAKLLRQLQQVHAALSEEPELIMLFQQPAALAYTTRRYLKFVQSAAQSPVLAAAAVVPADVALLMLVHVADPAAFEHDLEKLVPIAAQRACLLDAVKVPLVRTITELETPKAIRAWTELTGLDEENDVPADEFTGVTLVCNFPASLAKLMDVLALTTQVSDIETVRKSYARHVDTGIIMHDEVGSASLYFLEPADVFARIGELMHAAHPAAYQSWFEEAFGARVSTLSEGHVDAHDRLISDKTVREVQVGAKYLSRADVKAHLANKAYLMAAERRYVAYLNALDTTPESAEVIPPADVALMMQMHMALAPAFVRDMRAFARNEEAFQRIMAVTAPFFKSVAAEPLNADMQAKWGRITHEPFVLTAYDANRALTASQAYKRMSPISFDLSLVLPQFVETVMASTTVTAAQVKAAHSNWTNKSFVVTLADGTQELASIASVTPTSRIGCVISTGRPLQHQAWFETTYSVPIAALAPPKDEQTANHVIVTVSLDAEEKKADAAPKYSKIAFAKYLSAKLLRQLQQVHAALSEEPELITQFQQPAALAYTTRRYLKFVQSAAQSPELAAAAVVPADVALLMHVHMTDAAAFELDFEKLIPVAAQRVRLLEAVKVPLVRTITELETPKSIRSWTQLTGLDEENDVPAESFVEVSLSCNFAAALAKFMDALALTVQVSDIESVRKAYARHVDTGIIMHDEAGFASLYFLEPADALARIGELMHTAHPTAYQEWFHEEFGAKVSTLINAEPRGHDALISDKTVREVQVMAKYLSRADVKAHLASKAYLMAAERRYVAYLHALNTAPETDAVIPPADVALMMQLHMALAPAFVRDMRAFASNNEAYQRIMDKTAPFFKSVAAEPLNADMQAKWGRITHEPFVLTANDANHALTASQAYKRTAPISVDLSLVLPQFVETVMASTKVTADQITADHNNWTSKSFVVTLADGDQELVSIASTTPASRIGCIISTGRPLQHQTWFDTTYGVSITKLAPPAPTHTAEYVKVMVSLDADEHKADATPKYSKLAFAKYLSAKLLRQLQQVHAALSEEPELIMQFQQADVLAISTRRYLKFLQSAAQSPDLAATAVVPADVALLMHAHMAEPVAFERDLEMIVPVVAQRVRLLEAVKVPLVRTITELETPKAIRAWTQLTGLDNENTTPADTFANMSLSCNFAAALPKFMDALALTAQVSDVELVRKAYTRHVDTGIIMHDEEGRSSLYFLEPANMLARVGELMHTAHPAAYQLWFKTEFGANVSTIFDQQARSNDELVTDASVRQVQVMAKYLTKTDVKAHLANRTYLAAAERRYVTYLKALNTSPEAGSLIPPADVALMMQVHMASPAVFARDIDAFAANKAARQRIMGKAMPFHRAITSEPMPAEMQAKWGKETHEPFVLTIHEAAKVVVRAKGRSPVSMNLVLALPSFVASVSGSVNVTAETVRTDYTNAVAKSTLMTLANGTLELHSIATPTAASAVGHVICTGHPEQYQIWFRNTFGVPVSALAPPIRAADHELIKVTVMLEDAEQHNGTSAQFSKIAFAKFLSTKLLKQLHAVHEFFQEHEDVLLHLLEPAALAHANVRFLRFIQAIAATKTVPSELVLPLDVALIMQALMANPAAFEWYMEQLIASPAQRTQFLASVEVPLVQSILGTASSKARAQWERATGLSFDATEPTTATAVDVVFDLSENVPLLLEALQLAAEQAVGDIVAIRQTYAQFVESAIVMQNEAGTRSLYSFQPTTDYVKVATLMHSAHPAAYQAWFQEQFRVKVSQLGSSLQIPKSFAVVQPAEDLASYEPVSDALVRQSHVIAKYLAKPDVKAHLANEAYLVAAERRYISYLKAMATSADAAAVVPPADVALLMQVHMASPEYFARDVAAFTKDSAAVARILGKESPLFQSVSMEPATAEMQSQWGIATHEPYVLTVQEAAKSFNRSRSAVAHAPVSVDLVAALPAFVESILGSVRVSGAQIRQEYANYMAKSMVVTLADGKQELHSIATPTVATKVGHVLATSCPAKYQRWFMQSFGVPVTALASSTSVKKNAVVKVLVSLDTAEMPVEKQAKFSKLSFAKYLSAKLLKQLHRTQAFLAEHTSLMARLADPAGLDLSVRRYVKFLHSAASAPARDLNFALPVDVALLMQAHMANASAFARDMAVLIPDAARRTAVLKSVELPLIRSMLEPIKSANKDAWKRVTGLSINAVPVQADVSYLDVNFDAAVSHFVDVLDVAASTSPADLEAIRQAVAHFVEGATPIRSEDGAFTLYSLKLVDSHIRLGWFMLSASAADFPAWFQGEFGAALQDVELGQLVQVPTTSATIAERAAQLVSTDDIMQFHEGLQALLKCVPHIRLTDVNEYIETVYATLGHLDAVESLPAVTRLIAVLHQTFPERYSWDIKAIVCDAQVNIHEIYTLVKHRLAAVERIVAHADLATAAKDYQRAMDDAVVVKHEDGSEELYTLMPITDGCLLAHILHMTRVDQYEWFLSDRFEHLLSLFKPVVVEESASAVIIDVDALTMPLQNAKAVVPRDASVDVLLDAASLKTSLAQLKDALRRGPAQFTLGDVKAYVEQQPPQWGLLSMVHATFAGTHAKDLLKFQFQEPLDLPVFCSRLNARLALLRSLAQQEGDFFTAYYEYQRAIADAVVISNAQKEPELYSLMSMSPAAMLLHAAHASVPLEYQNFALERFGAVAGVLTETGEANVLESASRVIAHGHVQIAITDLSPQPESTKPSHSPLDHVYVSVSKVSHVVRVIREASDFTVGDVEAYLRDPIKAPRCEEMHLVHATFAKEFADHMLAIQFHEPISVAAFQVGLNARLHVLRDVVRRVGKIDLPSALVEYERALADAFALKNSQGEWELYTLSPLSDAAWVLHVAHMSKPDMYENFALAHFGHVLGFFKVPPHLIRTAPAAVAVQVGPASLSTKHGHVERALPSAAPSFVEASTIITYEDAVRFYMHAVALLVSVATITDHDVRAYVDALQECHDDDEEVELVSMLHTTHVERYLNDVNALVSGNSVDLTQLRRLLEARFSLLRSLIAKVKANSLSDAVAEYSRAVDEAVLMTAQDGSHELFTMVPLSPAALFVHVAHVAQRAEYYDFATRRFGAVVSFLKPARLIDVSAGELDDDVEMVVLERQLPTVASVDSKAKQVKIAVEHWDAQEAKAQEASVAEKKAAENSALTLEFLSGLQSAFNKVAAAGWSMAWVLSYMWFLNELRTKEAPAEVPPVVKLVALVHASMCDRFETDLAQLIGADHVAHVTQLLSASLLEDWTPVVFDEQAASHQELSLDGEEFASRLERRFASVQRVFAEAQLSLTSNTAYQRALDTSVIISGPKRRAELFTTAALTPDVLLAHVFHTSQVEEYRRYMAARFGQKLGFLPLEMVVDHDAESLRSLPEADDAIPRPVENGDVQLTLPKNKVHHADVHDAKDLDDKVAAKRRSLPKLESFITLHDIEAFREFWLGNEMLMRFNNRIYIVNAIQRYQSWLSMPYPILPPPDVAVVHQIHKFSNRIYEDLHDVYAEYTRYPTYTTDEAILSWERATGTPWTLNNSTTYHCRNCYATIALTPATVKCVICRTPLLSSPFSAVILNQAQPFLNVVRTVPKLMPIEIWTSYATWLEQAIIIGTQDGSKYLRSVQPDTDAVLVGHLVHVMHPARFRRAMLSLFGMQISFFMPLLAHPITPDSLLISPPPTRPQSPHQSAQVVSRDIDFGADDKAAEDSAAVLEEIVDRGISVDRGLEVELLTSLGPKFIEPEVRKVRSRPSSVVKEPPQAPEVNGDIIERHWALVRTLLQIETSYDPALLVRSESRYLKWLTMLSETKQLHLIPPVDVALMFHIHAQFPDVFYQDLVALFGEEDARELLDFSILDADVGYYQRDIDPESEAAWESYTGEPYLYHHATAATAYMLSCPACSTIQSVGQDDIVQLKTQVCDLKCPTCDRQSTLEQLRVNNRGIAPFHINFIHQAPVWRARMSKLLNEASKVVPDAASAKYEQFARLTVDVVQNGTSTLYSIVDLDQHIYAGHAAHLLFPGPYRRMVQGRFGRWVPLIKLDDPLPPFPIAAPIELAIPAMPPIPTEELVADTSARRSRAVSVATFTSAVSTATTAASEPAPEFTMRGDTLVSFFQLCQALLKCADFKITDEAARYLFWYRAEARYVQFIELMQHTVVEGHALPLPPLDVLMMWMVHLMDPHRYIEDLVRISGDIKLLNFGFPLDKVTMYLVAHQDTLSAESWTAFVPSSHAESWTSFTKQPFILDAASQAAEALTCPYCHFAQEWECGPYTEMRRGTRVLFCKACDKWMTQSTLSAWRLVQDLTLAEKGQGHVGGTLLNLAKGKIDYKLAHSVHKLLFFTHSTSITEILDARLHELDVINPWKELDLAAILHDYLQTAVEKEYSGKRKDLKRKADIVTTKILAYYQNVVTPLSLDLVRSLDHWTQLTQDMVDHFNAFSLKEAETVLDRYIKFMRLLEDQRKDTNSSTNHLVPALDILLAHRCHLLDPLAFQKYCVFKFGKIMDFSRFTSKEELLQEYKDMGALWTRKYSTPFDVSFKRKKKKGIKKLVGMLFGSK